MVNMTIRYWDFRTILGVDPATEETCVAYKVTGSRDRCKIKRYYIGAGNLREAGLILDKMDRKESMSECQAELDKLARLMVCGHPHRKHLDALRYLVNRWNDKIEAYVALQDDEEVLSETVPVAMASSGAMAFGWSNERLNNRDAAIDRQPQQTFVPFGFGPVTISTTRVVQPEQIGPINTTLTSPSEVLLVAQTRDDQNATKEKTVVREETLSTSSGRYEFGANIQHNTQPCKFEFRQSSQAAQEDEESSTKGDALVSKQPLPPSIGKYEFGTEPQHNKQPWMFGFQQSSQDAKKEEEEEEDKETTEHTLKSITTPNTPPSEKPKIEGGESEPLLVSNGKYEFGSESQHNKQPWVFEFQQSSQDAKEEEEEEEEIVEQTPESIIAPDTPQELKIEEGEPLLASDGKFEFGSESQHKQPWIFEFDQNSQDAQENRKAADHQSKIDDTSPTFPVQQESQLLERLKIEERDLGTTPNFEEEISPLETDSESEGPVENKTDSTNTKHEQQPNYSADFSSKVVPTRPEITQHDSTSLETPAESTLSIYEIPKVQAGECASPSSEFPEHRDDLYFSPGEENRITSSSSANIVSTKSEADEETENYSTEVSPISEDLEEIFHAPYFSTGEENDLALAQIKEKIQDVNIPDTSTRDMSTLQETPILSIPEINDTPIIIEKRQTRSMTTSTTKITSPIPMQEHQQHLHPIPTILDSYGHATIHSTERRSSQRFSERRTTILPVKSSAEEAYKINFSPQEQKSTTEHGYGTVPPTVVKINKKESTAKKEEKTRKMESELKMREVEVTNVVREEIAWENDRGIIVKKPKGVRKSLEGFVQKVVTRGRRGLRSSDD